MQDFVQLKKSLFKSITNWDDKTHFQLRSKRYMNVSTHADQETFNENGIIESGKIYKAQSKCDRLSTEARSDECFEKGRGDSKDPSLAQGLVRIGGDPYPRREGAPTVVKLNSHAALEQNKKLQPCYSLQIIGVPCKY